VRGETVEHAGWSAQNRRTTFVVPS